MTTRGANSLKNLLYRFSYNGGPLQKREKSLIFYCRTTFSPAETEIGYCTILRVFSRCEKNDFRYDVFSLQNRISVQERAFYILNYIKEHQNIIEKTLILALKWGCFWAILNRGLQYCTMKFIVGDTMYWILWRCVVTVFCARPNSAHVISIEPREGMCMSAREIFYGQPIALRRFLPPVEMTRFYIVLQLAFRGPGAF